MPVWLAWWAAPKGQHQVSFCNGLRRVTLHVLINGRNGWIKAKYHPRFVNLGDSARSRKRTSLPRFVPGDNTATLSLPQHTFLSLADYYGTALMFLTRPFPTSAGVLPHCPFSHRSPLSHPLCWTPLFLCCFQMVSKEDVANSKTKEEVDYADFNFWRPNWGDISGG